MTAPDTVIAAIDAANAKDPRASDGPGEDLLYGQRMSAECDLLFPDASDLLKIAVRGQHIERWVLPRADYPQGREGYLTWRRDLGKHHATRLAALMAEAGYGTEECTQVEKMLMKQGIKRDPEVQALEDVACFTFLRWYFAPFAAKHEADKILRIVEKTARKMSPMARGRALEVFELPEDLAAPFRA